jgi:acetyl esterase/lipase
MLALNPDVPVTSQTPPTLLVQAADDPMDDVENSLVYYQALRGAGVSVEMHIFAHGGHAFGLRARDGVPITEWPRLAEAWMRSMGLIPE